MRRAVLGKGLEDLVLNHVHWLLQSLVTPVYLVIVSQSAQ